MNAFFRQINGALLCVMMIAPVYGMEHEGAELQNSQVWYKKRSVRIGAAVTGMAALYALAVRIGIVAIPAVVAGFCVKVAQNSSPINAQDNNDVVNNNDSISAEEPKNNQQQCNENQINVGDQFAEDADHDVNNIVEVVVKQEIKERATRLYNEIKDFGTNVMDSVKQLKSNMMNSVKKLKSEDLQQMHF